MQLHMHQAVANLAPYANDIERLQRDPAFAAQHQAEIERHAQQLLQGWHGVQGAYGRVVAEAAVQEQIALQRMREREEWERIHGRPRRRRRGSGAGGGGGGGGDGGGGDGGGGGGE